MENKKQQSTLQSTQKRKDETNDQKINNQTPHEQKQKQATFHDKRATFRQRAMTSNLWTMSKQLPMMMSNLPSDDK